MAITNNHSKTRPSPHKIVDMALINTKPITGPSHDPATLSESEEDEYGLLFFHLPDGKHGEFSQWYPSKFTMSKPHMSKMVGRIVDEADPDGTITFNCAEQYMTYCQAARFGDTTRQAQALASSDPEFHDWLGKRIKGYTIDGWDEVRTEVMEVGSIAKFGQDPVLRQKLLSTGGRKLCKASKNDAIYGIGYEGKMALHWDKRWGDNRLGKALMAARDYFLEQDYYANQDNPLDKKMAELKLEE
ncbi:hypothetical protein EDB81DRAFT_774637 [Dactylonectria macrodidyma]|uniref:NADAR domain-containing protein n=1 Tax=Dactylonectria macrodidyma TaxID=307937 RepID=A0A9P9FP20_9HYPO|nr:hypothetical protein EDB81DRAFT_774637 [Dactylonectria macrodidyma]